MKKIIIATIGSLLIGQDLCAESFESGVYWTCRSHDKQQQEWEMKNDYQLMALNHALESCKKESRLPQTCKVSKHDCDMVVNGVSTRPMWRCMALDEAALPWYSNFFDNANDALSSAKTFCKDNSALPDTCYAYLFSCINLNQRTF